MCDHSRPLPTNVEATDGADVPFANIISTVLNVYRDNSDHARKRIVDFCPLISYRANHRSSGQNNLNWIQYILETYCIVFVTNGFFGLNICYNPGILSGLVLSLRSICTWNDTCCMEKVYTTIWCFKKKNNGTLYSRYTIHNHICVYVVRAK